MGRNLGPAIHHYGRVLLQMGANHDVAEQDSNINGGQPTASPTDPGEAPLATCVGLASASGGDGDGLSEAIGLLQHIGVQVPNGDTDKLATASAAWAKVASDGDGAYKGKLVAASEVLSELNGEEVDFVVEDLEELNSLVDEYTELAGALKDSIESHKGYLSDVRAQIGGLLSDLAVELAVTATVGIVSSFVSFGVGGAIAGTKAAGTIARYGRKVTDVIETVKKLKVSRNIADFFSKSSASKSNDRLLHFLQLELKQATTQGQRNNLKGRIGELKAGIDPNQPKQKVRVNGRTRVPDEVDDIGLTVTEVKNTNTIGASQQIKDMSDWARSRGYTMELVVDNRTVISGPLQQMINNGQITLKRMALN